MSTGAEKKEKQYVSDNAQLIAEWNWEKNRILGYEPHKILLCSSIKAWWECQESHTWQARVYHRNNGLGCPYCSGRLPIKGINDLHTINPILAKEWNYDRNNDLTPLDVSPNSGKKVWWRCSEGHEWQAVIGSRNNGCGCPYCAGKIVITGRTDLRTINPILAEEWNYDRNNGLTPSDVLPNSNKKAWWRCDKGHEWQAVIYSRNNGCGCPYCSNKKVLKGLNDLQSVRPGLATEWNYEKNNGLTPSDVIFDSDKKFWWKCNKGHEWSTSIANRNKGTNCPVCNSEMNTSFPEYAFIYYLKKCGLTVIHSYKGLGYELDVYIPSRKMAIEYDGYFFHKDKAKNDLEKNLKCKKDGIKLYRIREGLPSLNDTSTDFLIQKNQKDLPQIIQMFIREIIGIDVDINFAKDAIDIENMREYTEKERSLLLLNPELATEWNHEKNGHLKPAHFTANSGKKVWWMCSEGHEWQASIKERNKGQGCPYCSGRYAIKGENDLQTINPTLAKEWDYEKNCGLTPMDVLPKRSKKVWWKCSNGHEWEAKICNRTIGHECPECAKQKRKKKDT